MIHSCPHFPPLNPSSGEPGVGKTAVAEGLAQKISNGDVPETIEGKQVVTLDMGLLVAGTKYRGEFEERLKKLMDEIKQNDDIILVRAGGRATCRWGGKGRGPRVDVCVRERVMGDSFVPLNLLPPLADD